MNTKRFAQKAFQLAENYDRPYIAEVRSLWASYEAGTLSEEDAYQLYFFLSVWGTLGSHYARRLAIHVRDEFSLDLNITSQNPYIPRNSLEVGWQGPIQRTTNEK